MKRHSASLFFIAIFFICIFTYRWIGLKYELFFMFWWYDVVAHFLGGIWVVALALSLKKIFYFEIQGAYGGWALLVFVLGMVILAGVFWEWWEFVSDRYIFYTNFTYLPNVFEDTLKDLLVDLLGGIAGFLIFRKI